MGTFKLYFVGAVGILIALLSLGLWYYHGKTQTLAAALANEQAYNKALTAGYAALSTRFSMQQAEAAKVQEELDVINKSPDGGTVPDPLRCAVGVCD